jgi:hypothetical protein
MWRRNSVVALDLSTTFCGAAQSLPAEARGIDGDVGCALLAAAVPERGQAVRMLGIGARGVDLLGLSAGSEALGVDGAGTGGAGSTGRRRGRGPGRHGERRRGDVPDRHAPRQRQQRHHRPTTIPTRDSSPSSRRTGAVRRTR